jgi:hypothetical protein
VTSTNFLLASDPAAFAASQLLLRPDPAQAQVLRCRSPRVILNCSRQWGKSTVTAARALFHALSASGALILVASPSFRQSAEFIRKVSGFLRTLHVKPRGGGQNAASLILPNSSRIVGIPGKQATIRGFSSVSFLLIDEAAQVPDDLYAAVRPMLAASNGSLWLLSTPHGQRGFFYETWSRGGPRWRRFRVPATLRPRISKQFLAEERRILGDRIIQQEYLCEFTENNRQFIPQHLIEAALTPHSLPLFPPGRSLFRK